MTLNNTLTNVVCDVHEWINLNLVRTVLNYDAKLSFLLNGDAELSYLLDYIISIYSFWILYEDIYVLSHYP
jgi:hypothetical protein